MKRKTKQFFVSGLTAVLAITMLPTPVLADSDVSTLKAEKSTIQTEIETLESQKPELKEDIEQITVDIVVKGEELAQAEVELDEALYEKREQQEKEYEDMKKRVVATHENEDTSLLMVMSEDKNITDLLNKGEAIKQIHEFDHNMVKEYAETKDELSELKTRLETDLEEMQNVSDTYSEQQASIDASIVEKQNKLADYDVKIEEAEKAAEELKAAKEEAKKSISSYKDPDNYRENEKTKLSKAITNGKNEIDKCSTKEAVEDALADAKATINNIKTDAQLDAEEEAARKAEEERKRKEAEAKKKAEEEAKKKEEANKNNNSSNGSTSSSTGNTSKAQTIVNAAYSQLGVKYVYGGTTPGVGLDCSGLTQYCHKVAGISIPRVSGDQASSGKNVGSISNAKPGDIICYSGHVGIYIGNNQMIHAPQTGDVVKISNVWRSKPIIAIRRYW